MKIQRANKGFTIVELMVVAAVIVVLALISVVGYNAYKNRSYASQTDANLRLINLAVKQYYAKNGSYPPSGNGSDTWSRLARDGTNFVPELTPYLKMPTDVEYGDKTSTWYNTILYRSNGREYKLIRLAANGQAVPKYEYDFVSTKTELQDPNRWTAGSPQFRGWGYWSLGAANW
ncbi:prepilin-type N-terminal cleavage/methylation domain-containing protein [Candidatus Saccharibacteria bacterium]|nr:prepilin-type N-terminal cleavage/methylation domain-containing protein [Candidatus Saccharibacteria bacterium]